MLNYSNGNYRAVCGCCSQFGGGLGILKLSVEVIDTLQLSLVQQLHRKSRNKTSLTLLPLETVLLLLLLVLP